MKINPYYKSIFNSFSIVILVITILFGTLSGLDYKAIGLILLLIVFIKLMLVKNPDAEQFKLVLLATVIGIFYNIIAGYLMSDMIFRFITMFPYLLKNSLLSIFAIIFISNGILSLFRLSEFKTNKQYRPKISKLSWKLIPIILISLAMAFFATGFLAQFMRHYDVLIIYTENLVRHSEEIFFPDIILLYYLAKAFIFMISEYFLS